MKRVWFPPLVLLLLVPAPAFLQDKPKEKIAVENDIFFGKGGDQELKLNVAMPAEGNGPFPAVICIHGGAWQAGSYKDMTGVARELAKRGYVAVSSGYRLAPKNQFPAAVEDCKCAVRWMRAHAQKYKIDPNRIGAVGLSAGGHLACMLGLTVKTDGLEGAGDLTPAAANQSSGVQAVCSWAGPTDFTKGDWDQEVDKLVVAFFGGTFAEKRVAYAKGSPVTYIRPGQKLPPFLFFHGTKDNIVRHSQSVKLYESLKAAGGIVRLESIEGEGHGWFGDKLKKSTDQMYAFFDEHLKKSSGAAKQ